MAVLVRADRALAARGPREPVLRGRARAAEHRVLRERARLAWLCGREILRLGLQPNSLLTKQPDAPSEYFPLFDKVHVGTTAYYDPKTLKPWNRRNRAIVYDAGEELFLLISACSEHPFYLHTLAGVIWRPRGNLTVQITPVQRGDIWSWLRG